MRILLLGSSGQLGQELLRSLPLLGEVIAPNRAELDVAEELALRDAIREISPALIVNASAYTQVDQAELEPQLAFRINAHAPEIMALESSRIDSGLIHFSTDFVFDGAKRSPYTESDQPKPLNTYGRSKLEGEQAVAQSSSPHLILRTSWVYRLRGSHQCFPRKVMAWAKRLDELYVVEDQIGTPTWARDLAQAVAMLLISDTKGDAWKPRDTGLFHLTGTGQTSRLGWARATLEGIGLPKAVRPARNQDFKTLAIRPHFSVLDCGAFHETFGFTLPEWTHSFRLALADLHQTNLS